MKFSIATWAFLYGQYTDDPWPLERILRWTKEAGFDGTEFCGFLSELDNAHTSDHLPLGEGILDLDAIIDALWPYAGHLPYWSLDFYACHDAERTGRESLQILREKVQRKM